MKKFCVISVDKEGYVPREGHPSIIGGLKSLEDQTFKDFNVILIHDGPKSISYYEEGVLRENMPLDVTVMNTEQEHGDFGNWSRDLAMRFANENNLGEYYIHHNVDNEFFPDALQAMSNAIDKYDERVFIFPIHHWKLIGGGILTGVPPVLFGIDTMQLVAHRDIWREVGYWYDTHRWSDGYIYEAICKEFPWREVPHCIGHNY